MGEELNVISIVNHRIIRTEPFNNNQCHRPVGDILVQYNVVWATPANEIRHFEAPYSWVNDNEARTHFPRLVMLYWTERTQNDFADYEVDFTGNTFTLPVGDKTWTKDKLQLESLKTIYTKSKMTRNHLQVRFRAIFVEIKTSELKRIRPLENIWTEIERLKKDDEVDSLFNETSTTQYEQKMAGLMSSVSFQNSLQTVVDNISCYSYLNHDLSKKSSYKMHYKEIRKRLDQHDAQLKQWNNYPEKLWTIIPNHDSNLQANFIKNQSTKVNWDARSRGQEKKPFKRKRKRRSSPTKSKPKNPLKSNAEHEPTINNSNEHINHKTTNDQSLSDIILPTQDEDDAFETSETGKEKYLSIIFIYIKYFY